MSDVTRTSGAGRAPPRVPPSSTPLDFQTPLADPQAAKDDADPAVGKKKVQDFMNTNAKIKDLFEEPSPTRRYFATMAKDSTGPFMGVVVGAVVGVPLFLGGALGAGLVALTFGATSIPGLIFTGLGTAVLTIATFAAVLGIVQAVNKHKFNKEVEALVDKKANTNLKALKDQLREIYENQPTKFVRMQLVAAQIKYDDVLDDPQKKVLLEQFAGKQVTSKDLKELKAAFNDARNIELLKGVLKNLGADMDTTATNFEDFYREVKNEMGTDFPFSDDLRALRRRGTHKAALAELLNQPRTDEQFWKQLSALDRKIEKEQKKAANT